MATMTGLDVLVEEGFERLLGRNVGLVCNQASISRTTEHVLDLMLPLHREGKFNLARVFGPQHGLYGHTQDNMIEWEGREDERTGLSIVSLYGEHREPTDKMLAGIDLLVFDLQDVGARYYTFIWSLYLCMKKCTELAIPILVLDRPNPINGLQVEGTVLDPAFASFVGLQPFPMRHGMTVGEIAHSFQQRFFAECPLEVLQLRGWSRSDYFDDLDLPWGMPSPNMPTIDTAVVYPGACLLEGTNLSEGRGTTRPFEIFGAPFLDGWKFCEALNDLDLPGCRFRPLQFQPTFQKHAGELCEGAFLHVLDRQAFEPVLSYVAVMQEARRQAGDQFRWNDPPYEYEYEKLPIDILHGNSWLREAIDALAPLPEIRMRMLAECTDFEPERSAALIYPSAG